MKSIEVGDRAPDLITTASDGQRVSLADFQGNKIVVIFFYPRDNSPVCTQEACAFRDACESFTELGAVVIGVSGNSDDSHRSFAATQKLPYLLIADSGGSIRKLFGVPNFLFVIPGRVTYVIDREGIVRLKFNSLLNANRHVEEAMRVVRELSSSQPRAS